MAQMQAGKNQEVLILPRLMTTKLPPIVTRSVRILLDYAMTKSVQNKDLRRGLAPRQPMLKVKFDMLSWNSF